MRVAVLDDYQDVALSSADWSTLPADTEVVVFREHEADEAALWRVLALVELDDWAAGLPQGLRTRVGESGGLLSGGQALEEFAIRRASSALTALAGRMPALTHRRVNDTIVDAVYVATQQPVSAEIRAGLMTIDGVFGRISDAIANNAFAVNVQYDSNSGAPLSVALSGLEIIVVLVQAYVFTLLTAVFIGMAIHVHH